MKVDTSPEELFPEDVAQYKEAVAALKRLTPEAYEDGFYVAQAALVMVDRWNEIKHNAGKTASEKKTSKMALYRWASDHAEWLLYLHTFCRSLWNKGHEIFRKVE